MLTYNYTARNPQTGKVVKANVQADSEAAAAKLISAEGLVATDISLEGQGFKLLGGVSKRVKAKDRVLFSRQLSTLINAGLPLLQALRSVNQQTTSKSLKIVLSQVIGDVEGGSTLANSMAKHPRVFNQVYLSLIAAGESSGTLDQALDRLAIQQEKEADLNAKIRGAMIYPLVVVVVMVAVVGFMVVKVLPQVRAIYDGFDGAELPFITKIMLAVSDFTIHFWWVVILVIAAATFFTTRWARTGPGKEVTDKIKMRAWPIGKLFMKVYMARFARTGTTLVASGVPLL
ncbi:type II secretion system F family protein, partial [Candidatus Saccharibacteria bacterium]|nr:type II secretion system F family protein [Candidatus Saccharibacteria bacterium]